jgi:hypothetical protein
VLVRSTSERVVFTSEDLLSLNSPAANRTVLCEQQHGADHNQSEAEPDP